MRKLLYIIFLCVYCCIILYACPVHPSYQPKAFHKTTALSGRVVIEGSFDTVRNFRYTNPVDSQVIIELVPASDTTYMYECWVQHTEQMIIGRDTVLAVTGARIP